MDGITVRGTSWRVRASGSCPKQQAVGVVYAYNAFTNAGGVPCEVATSSAFPPLRRGSNPAQWDYRLKPDSRAVGLVPESQPRPSTDIDGNLRPLRWPSDAGAYQRETALMVLGRSIGAASIGDKRSAVIAFFGVPQRTDHSRSGRHALSTLVYHLHGGLLWVTLERGRVVGIGTTSSYYTTSAGARAGGIGSRIAITDEGRVGQMPASLSPTLRTSGGPVRAGAWKGSDCNRFDGDHRDDAGVSMSGATTRRLARRSGRLVPRPIYRHVRHAYQTVANRSFLQSRRALASLLSQFVARGDLVFDIGANVGDYTDVLLTLDARVVAIEPNPVLAQAIRRRYRVAVEAVAVGSKSGSLDLHVGVDQGHSTLSARWLEQAPTGHRWSGERIAVPVVTLEDLAERHGPPDFVKIDVEGFEAEVLRGCSDLPPALSFEYQSANLDVAVECLGMLDGYEFNTVHLQGTRLDSAWVMHDPLIKRLRERAETHPDTYGDVYARRLP